MDERLRHNGLLRSIPELCRDRIRHCERPHVKVSRSERAAIRTTCQLALTSLLTVILAMVGCGRPPAMNSPVSQLSELGITVVSDKRDGVAVNVIRRRVGRKELSLIAEVPNITTLTFIHCYIDETIDTSQYEQLTCLQVIRSEFFERSQLLLDGRRLAMLVLDDVRGVAEDDVRGMATLSRLEELWIANTAVGDGLVLQLRNTQRLRRLVLANTLITDEALSRFEACPKLADLDLSGTQISDFGLARLVHLRRLERLVLCDTGLNGSGLQHLGALSSLRILLLDGTAINDESLRSLASCRALAELSLADTEITDSSIEYLSSIKSMKLLQLRYTRVSTQAAEELRRRHPHWVVWH